MKSSYVVNRKQNGKLKKQFTPSLRFRIDGVKQRWSTKIEVPASLWLTQGLSTSVSKIKEAGYTMPQVNSINSRLEQLQAKLHDLHGLELLESEYSLDNVKTQWEAFRDGAVAKPRRRSKPTGTLLVDMIPDFIQHKQTQAQRTTAKQKPVKRATVNNYAQVVAHVSSFDDYRKRPTMLHEVTLKWRDDFVKFMTDKLQLASSTQGKQIRNLKTALKWADQSGMNVSRDVYNDQFCEPYVDEEVEPMDAVLTWDEINVLRKMKLSGTAEIARDLFVISCHTGMRASDLQRLDRAQVVQTSKGPVIQYTPQKAKSKPITVTMWEEVRDIHDRWKGWPPSITSQAINNHLKRICKAAGFSNKMEGKIEVKIDVMDKQVRRKVIKRLPRYNFITCHSGRRSFCTNWYDFSLENPKMTVEQIMRWSGHTKEQVFFMYINRQPTADGSAGFDFRK